MNKDERCPWCGTDPIYVQYHDTVWGVPEFDDKKLFAKLILDGAQAGLSWITILKREQGYYRAFDGLDPEKMIYFSPARMEKLLQDEGIIRNRLKIHSAIKNAHAWVEMQHSGLNFGQYLWSFVDGKPIQNQIKSMEELPASTPLAHTISKDLKRRGFNFVGPTIVYAFMQAVGMVNDHLVHCHRYEPINELGKRILMNNKR